MWSPARTSQRGKIEPFTERIGNLSGLFPFSAIFGLMPCAENDSLNRQLTLYAVFSQAAYRILNVAVLINYLISIKTSASLMILLGISTVMKFLSAAVHLVVVVQKRRKFLKLVETCEKAEFFNGYRTLTKCGPLYLVYLYLVARLRETRWQSVIRDVFSMLDVFIPILIILQFCTFLKIASDRFKTSRMRLVVCLYQINTIDHIVEEHLRDLDMVADLQDLYSWQILFCVCYLGFDFFVASYDMVELIASGNKPIRTVTTTSYCTLCLSTIMMLGRACEVTKEKAGKFDDELFLLLNDNHTLRRNPKLKLYLKRKIPIRFTGGHFFDLGYPLVTKIVAATLTYLLFLIQFSDSS